MSENKIIPFGEIIGIVSHEQAKPYQSLLHEGETFRMFNPNNILELLGDIPGEAGKILRETQEYASTTDIGDVDRQRLNRAIIRCFFKTTTHPKDVRFLLLMQADGKPAKPSQLAYPVAFSNLAQADIVK